MKVLFLTTRLPYQMLNGGLIKSHFLVRFLAEHTDLTVACLLKGESDVKNLTAFEKWLSPANVHTVACDKPRSGINFIKSCFSGLPLTVFRNRAARFKALVKRLCQDADVLFVDHYVMYQYVPGNVKAKVIVHQHNAEFLNWQRKAELEDNLLLSMLINFEVARIKQYELQMCANADLVLASFNDIKSLVAVGADRDNFQETLHLGIEDNIRLPALAYQNTKPEILFVGDLSWEPNVDGILWFAREVWPLLRQSSPDCVFNIIGKCHPKLQHKLEKLMPQANVLGFVEDLEPYYSSQRVFVAPARIGSGVKIKVVNAMYRGLPLVASPIAIEGLTITHDKQALIAESAQDFAQNISTLLNEQQRWQRLSRASRVWSKRYYSARTECRNLRQALCV